MHKVLISLAAAGTALVFASPAAAQFYPVQAQGYQGQGYGYQGQGYGYGQNNWGQNRGGMRALQHRVNRVERDIEQLRARRLLSRNEANGLRTEARGIERRIYRASRNGLHYAEMRNIEHRIARLEQHVRREVADGNRRGGRGYGQYAYGQDGAYSDRDRDGRNDRFEDDRGQDHD